MLARFRLLRSTHLRALSVAVLGIAFSAGLVFASPPALPDQAGTGLANAGLHAGKVVPVRAGLLDEETAEDEDTEADEDATSDEETEVEELDEETGDNCATDPTGLTDEELAAMRHGSIVCWAAHQDSWPEEFKNHGQWVSSWAKWKAPDGDPEAEAATSPGNGKSKGKGHAKP